LETTTENLTDPDYPSECDLILEDRTEPENDFTLDLMSALYKKKKSQLVMIPNAINGTPVTALIDSGAQGLFVSKSVVNKLQGAVSIRSVPGETVRCPNFVKEAFIRYSNGFFLLKK
jgi:hypothetical protein